MVTCRTVKHLYSIKGQFCVCNTQNCPFMCPKRTLTVCQRCLADSKNYAKINSFISRRPCPLQKRNIWLFSFFWMLTTERAVSVIFHVSEGTTSASPMAFPSKLSLICILPLKSPLHKIPIWVVLARSKYLYPTKHPSVSSLKK